MFSVICISFASGFFSVLLYLWYARQVQYVEYAGRISDARTLEQIEFLLERVRVFGFKDLVRKAYAARRRILKQNAG